MSLLAPTGPGRCCAYAGSARPPAVVGSSRNVVANARASYCVLGSSPVVLGSALPAGRSSVGGIAIATARQQSSKLRQRTITSTFADPVMDAPDVDDEDDGVKWDPTKLTAVVVGAGPTGALAAHYLAMRGYSVQVFDKGPRPTAGDAASRPLVLTSRGAIAFEELGLDSQRRVGPTATPLRGVWDVVGRRLRPLDSSSIYRRVFVTDRSGLAADVIAAAERKYPDTVRFQFNTELVRAELKNRVAGVRPTTAATPSSSGSPAASSSSAAAEASTSTSATVDPTVVTADEVEVPYDLLVGADGVESSVRRILKAKVKDFSVIRPVEEEGGFKPVVGLRLPEKEPIFGFSTHRPQEYMYEWAAPGAPTVRLYIDVCGTVAGTVAGVAAWEDGPAVAAALLAAYPEFPPEWAEGIAAQVSAPGSPPPRIPAILQCSQFHGPRTVLVGDAAHAVTQAMPPAGQGQGPSAAVESVRTLALVLRGAQDDLDKVPEVYSNVRGDAVMAMQMLEFMELTRQKEQVRKLKFTSMWYALSATITQGFRWLAGAIGGILAFLMPSRFFTAAQVVSKLDDRRIGYSEVIRMLQGYASPVIMTIFLGASVGLFLAYSHRLA